MPEASPKRKEGKEMKEMKEDAVDSKDDLRKNLDRSRGRSDRHKSSNKMAMDDSSGRKKERSRDRSKDEGRETRRRSADQRHSDRRRRHSRSPPAETHKKRREPTPPPLDFVMWRDESEGKKAVCSRWEFLDFDKEEKRRQEREERKAAGLGGPPMRGGFGAPRGAFRGGFRGRGFGPPPPVPTPISPPGSNFKRNFRIYPATMADKTTTVIMSDRWQSKEEPASEEGADGHADNPSQRPQNAAYGGIDDGKGGMRSHIAKGGGFNFARLGTREEEERPQPVDPSKPVMHLFDPTSVPKGRAYFDHDNRGGGDDRDGGRFRSSAPERRPYDAYQRGGWGGGERRDERWGSGRRDERTDDDRRSGGFGGPPRQSAGFPSRRREVDMAWGHDGFKELEAELDTKAAPSPKEEPEQIA